MKRILIAVIIILMAGLAHSYLLSNAYCNLVNTTSLSYNAYNLIIPNSVITQGAIYGMSALYPIGGPYTCTNSGFARIAFEITNNGNYADNSLVLSVDSTSNNAGYTGQPWSYYLEVNSVNAGTNYNVPDTLFSEGAVLKFYLVAAAPPLSNQKSVFYASVSAEIISNSNHIAAIYTGFDGLQYGGFAKASAWQSAAIGLANKILAIYASDSINTITDFSGSASLRRIKNRISLQISSSPAQQDGVKLWYSTAGVADGPQGFNVNQASKTMNAEGPLVYSIEIPQNNLVDGKIFSFLVEIDGEVYGSNYIYNLMSVNKQEPFETVLMDNLLKKGENSVLSILLPDRVVGKTGNIIVYSISGERQKDILKNAASSPVYNWDGKDNNGKMVASGMYFIVIDIDNVKEIRKAFVN